MIARGSGGLGLSRQVTHGQVPANLVQDGKTTGQLNVSTGAVKTQSKIILQLTSLFISGLAIPVPKTCQSATPAQVDLASLKGFSVVKGGNLAGTYTIPPVANCGELTALLNVIFPGPGNTIKLKLGAAKVVSQRPPASSPSASSGQAHHWRLHSFLGTLTTTLLAVEEIDVAPPRMSTGLSAVRSLPFPTCPT